MKIYALESRQTIDRPIEAVFAFFADPSNLDRLTPSWLKFQILTPAPIAMRVGARIEYTIRWRGIPIRWLTEIEEWTPEEGFVDVQVRGPYRLWRHTHRFEEAGDATIVQDIVRYALPMGPLGNIAHALLVRRDLERVFNYRARRIQELLGSDKKQSLAIADTTTA